jgi:menaquinone-dependent protoporphyrinogen oxidase
MSDKILVTYASRAGSTVGVAEMIGKTLREHNLTVDVMPMQEVDDLSPYRAVVAGSAIRIDRWLPEAMQFVKRHQAELNQKPFAPFLVCLALSATNEKRLKKAKQGVSNYLQPVRDLVTPVSEGRFAGVLDLSRIPELRYRLLFRIPVMLGFFAEGDFRDWNSIRDWANNLATKLSD